MTNEDKFYETGGPSDQISEQVTNHIASNRSVFSHNDDQTEYRDLVIFSAWPFSGKKAYTNNLDDVAIEGRVQFISKITFTGDRPWMRRADYESDILENPTWLDVCLCANDMINVTSDHHHIFLEAVHKTGSFTLDDKSFILLYDFSMGS